MLRKIHSNMLQKIHSLNTYSSHKTIVKLHFTSKVSKIQAWRPIQDILIQILNHLTNNH